ncbi:hypothetical protein K488DRAFT_38030, partial [Vararia minispora EC-137]
TCPPISGLFFDPSLLLQPTLASVTEALCLSTFFAESSSNQAMLFSCPSPAASSLPPFLQTLLDTVADVLRPAVSARTHALLFQAQPGCARQAIVNLYHPGEGIAPHVDLPARYGDGVIGVSLGAGCAMRFLWLPPLPPRSLVVLTGEARYEWTHGIVARETDIVQDVGEVMRGTRVSVTFRWLLPGADVVG